MDTDTTQQVEDLLGRLHRELHCHETAAATTRQAIRALETWQTGQPAPRLTAGDTSRMALDLLCESDRVWTAREATKVLEQRGWETTSRAPVEAVRAALARLVKHGHAVRLGYGAYRRVSPEPPGE